MSTCNDPKCPLNRQGVWHDTHEEMGQEKITNQCNDPRCAMNRMGMVHNEHDEFYVGMRDLQKITGDQHDPAGPDEPLPTKGRPPVGFTMKKEWSDQQESEQLARYRQRMRARRAAAETQEQAKNETVDGDASHALNELLKNISNETRDMPHAGKSERQQTMTRQQTHAGTHAQASNEPDTAKPSEKGSILAAKNPHEVFGLPRDTTCPKIKSRYRELARTHDSSRGRISKSEHDRERADAVMTRINKAYSDLKAMHGCR